MDPVKNCAHCGARWLEGQHYWATGALGNELDLAGLVCNNHGTEDCINPKRGEEGGDTWEQRLQWINDAFNSMQARFDELTGD